MPEVFDQAQENFHDEINAEIFAGPDSGHPGHNWSLDGNGMVALQQVATIPSLPDDDESSLATGGQAGKPSKCNGLCWYMDSPLKSSKGGWLIRMRSCRRCGRKVRAVTYIDDDFYEYLQQGENYGKFKKEIEALNLRAT